ncbi:hypothetical protein AGR56_04415 [Clostridium sp. DMHC 10]|uniref:DUF5320 domain-containing protein n=1 Tax=Clostridium sp. DMHC 10 TaxID=747377 RepID=UPI00069D4360|nr:DUF5320 domain-containing protein [Clostridium sp. DMHC 10]KOF56160.1 hypothetical protein AGR56_04415 [Clostridium sp. DMHC 10]
MPRRDGTGPIGMGSMTGRGMGLCNTAKALGAIGGLGLGCRRGLRRNGFNNTINSDNIKDLLNEQKAILENRLDLINNQLNNFQDDK